MGRNYEEFDMKIEWTFNSEEIGLTSKMTNGLLWDVWVG